MSNARLERGRSTPISDAAWFFSQHYQGQFSENVQGQGLQKPCKEENKEKKVKPATPDNQDLPPSFYM